MNNAAQPVHSALEAHTSPNRRATAPLIGAAILAALAFTSACGSSSQTVTSPAQVRCSMSAQVESASFPADGGNGTIRITTARECSWSARSEVGWLVLTSAATGQGDGVVGFTVGANNTPAPRSAAITVNDTQQQISQEGRPCQFDLSSEHEVLTSGGGERTIQITASSDQCGWTAAAGSPWITITEGREGSGNGRVRFTVAPATGPPRTGTLTVAGETVRVEQGTGCAFAVNPSSVSVPAAGGEHVVRVEASSPECAWTAASEVPWIVIAGAANGSGSGTVTLRVAATDGPPRASTITVAGQTVTIDQGTGCAIDLNPASSNVPAQGGAIAIAVQSGPGCAWTAAASQEWISIASGGQGNGPGRVDLSVAANTGPARSGSVSVGGRMFAVSQASGCSYSIAPTAQNVEGGSASGAVSVATAAGCPWTASSSASWITLASTSGNGPGDLRFTAAPNESPARSGTITVAGHVFTLNQASLCTYILLPPAHQFDASGGNGNVLIVVSGPCTWTAVSTVDWIQMTAGTSGRGNGLIQFAVSPNAGPARTGSVMIAGQQYRVTQGGQ